VEAIMTRWTGTLVMALVVAGTTGVAAQGRPTTPAPAAQDNRPGVAVLDFDIGGTVGQDPDDYQALRRGLAALTLAELTAQQGIRVVERAQLQQILQEQNLGREGRLDNNALVNVGRLIGARYMITGTLIDIRGDMRIDARIFDTETSQILRAQSVRGRMDNLYDMVTRLSGQLMRDLNLPRTAAAPTAAPPTQAVMAYSRAQLYADRGDTQRAVEQYRRATQIFPQFTRAIEDCNRLQAGACGS
jgi:curli biogenesis system outer membrane secretion channel CsgG